MHEEIPGIQHNFNELTKEELIFLKEELILLKEERDRKFKIYREKRLAQYNNDDNRVLPNLELELNKEMNDAD